MKKKVTKKTSTRGKKSKLKDLAPKADPKAGGDVNGDRLLVGNTGNTGNTGIGLLLPAVQKVYSK
jgi:hypothetical protein